MKTKFDLSVQKDFQKMGQYQLHYKITLNEATRTRAKINFKLFMRAGTA